MLDIKQVAKVLQQAGKDGKFVVTFIKVDGTERTFNDCRMDFSNKSEEGFYDAIPNVLPVIVEEEGGTKWRSFKTDRVVSIFTV
jgi:hypothetical protein